MRCITHHLQVAYSHKRLSIPHLELQQSAHCKYKTCHVWVTKLMDAATAGHHWSRCRHRLRLQLPLPLSQIFFCSLRSQWICNDCASFWIGDGGRQVIKTAERSGSACNAGCGAGYNTTCWVCLWRYSECWCSKTACTRCGGWNIHWQSLFSGRGGSHALSHICNGWIVQRRWGGGVLTLDGRGYRTPSLRGIPLATGRYGNASLTRVKWRIPQRPTRMLILTSTKTSNILYDLCRVTVRSWGRHRAI